MKYVIYCSYISIVVGVDPPNTICHVEGGLHNQSLAWYWQTNTIQTNTTQKSKQRKIQQNKTTLV